MTATTALPLQTVSDSGQAPTKRVRDAHDAQQIVQALVYSGRERARFNAKIKGMLDGNAPYDAVKLKQNAQAYRANVNFRGGKAALSAALVPYYDLFAGGQYYCEVRLNLDDPDETEIKSGIVTEEFDWLLKKYNGFEFQMNGVFHDYVAFGKGFVMFPTTWGWHFKRVQFSKVFVPDATEASIEELEVCAIREKMQLHKLWQYIANRQVATDAGWDTEAVAQAIRTSIPEQRQTQTNPTLSYEYVQQMMRDRDILEGTKQPTVQVAHLLVKEFDGTITHMIVREAEGASASPGSVPSNTAEHGAEGAPQVEFLFCKRGQFKNMREVLSGFFFETLDGSWNGACGIGHDIYAPIEIQNRLLCKIVDNAFLSGGITLQAKDASSRQKTNLVQAGDFNIIPEGYDVQNAQIFANSRGLIDANQLLDQNLSSNTGIFKAKMEKPAGNPRTAKEVEIQYQNATVLSNSGTSRFYGQLDPFYEELYRRVTTEQVMDSDNSEEAKSVREFRRRCGERGVTIVDLRRVDSVRACRNIGNGSQVQRQQSLERFEPFVPMLGEAGKDAWMEDLVAAEFGPSKVPRYVPPRDKQLRPNDQQAMAMLENAALKIGAPVAVTPTQNSVIHATEHLKAMSGAAASLEHGAEPLEVLSFLHAAGPHVVEHLNKLQGDKSRQNEFKALWAKLQEVTKFADQLERQAQKQHEEQQKAQAEQMQQQSAAAQHAKLIESMNYKDAPEDIKRQMEAAAGFQPSQEAQVDPKIVKTQHAMQLKDTQAQQKMAIERQQADQSLAINDLKTSQQIRHAEEKQAAQREQIKKGGKE